MHFITENNLLHAHIGNLWFIYCWQIFDFADQYRGKYSDSLPEIVCPFYCSYSGYNVRKTITLNPKAL